MISIGWLGSSLGVVGLGMEWSGCSYRNEDRSLVS